MHGLSPLERRLFDWLSRRSDFVLVTLPFALFVGLGVVGIAAISAIADRSPLADPYVSWLIVVIAFTGLVLYLSAFYSLGAAFLHSRRFRLLELHQTMREIQAMSWREFEDLVAASYLARGYAVEPRGGWLEGPDGGIDLIVRKSNLTWLVQCKHWRNQWVDEKPLRELLGVVTSKGATGGIFVTCGVFDEGSMAFARSSEKLELVGGEQLRELVASAVRNKHPETTCPKCGSAMREKTGRYGAFLGCTNFPACHGWLPLPAPIRAD